MRTWRVRSSVRLLEYANGLDALATRPVFNRMHDRCQSSESMRKSVDMFRSINFVLLFGLAICAAGAHAGGGYTAPAGEVMLLPQFCWGQYNNSKLKGPQYHIHDCGPGMNHYCGALLGYNRAMGMSSRDARERELRRALEGVEYTLQWMKKWPACPIRGHVEKTYSRVRADLGMPPIVDQTPPASVQVPAAPVVGGAAQSPQDEETKPVEIQPEKIGSPTNPWCRFCPDPVDKK